MDAEDIRETVEKATRYAVDEAGRYAYRRRVVDQAVGELSRSDSRRIVVFDGPRRVGKSTALKQCLATLRQSEVATVWYCDLEDPYLAAAGLGGVVEALLPLARRDARSVILLDEVHNVVDWSRHLKTLADRHDRIRFAIADSCGHLVHSEIRTRLTGRTMRLAVHPLSFTERLELGEASGLPAVRQPVDLRTEAQRFLQTGGFPEVALSSEPLMGIRRLLKHDVLDAAIQKDVARALNIRRADEPRLMLYHLVASSGARLNKQTAAEMAKVSGPTVTSWVQAMVDTGIVWELPPYGTRKRSRAQPKIYAVDSALVGACARPSQSSAPQFAGALVETAVAQQLRRWAQQNDGDADLSFYSPAMGEADFVVETSGERIVFEVTAGDGSKKPAGLVRLLDNPDLEPDRAAIVAVRTASERLSIKPSGDRVRSVPVFALHDFLLALGDGDLESLPW